MSSGNPSSSRVVPQSRPSRVSDDFGQHTQSRAVAPDNDSSEGDSQGDENNGEGDLPMSMTASVMLTQLPKDASAALREVDAIDDRKSEYLSVDLLIHFHFLTICLQSLSAFSPSAVLQS